MSIQKASIFTLALAVAGILTTHANAAEKCSGGAAPAFDAESMKRVVCMARFHGVVPASSYDPNNVDKNFFRYLATPQVEGQRGFFGHLVPAIHPDSIGLGGLSHIDQEFGMKYEVIPGSVNYVDTNGCSAGGNPHVCVGAPR